MTRECLQNDGINPFVSVCILLLCAQLRLNLSQIPQFIVLLCLDFYQAVRNGI